MYIIFFITANMDVLTKVVVTYETLPGWCCSTEGARSFDELPPQAQAYIRFIEDFLQVPGKTWCNMCFLFGKNTHNCIRAIACLFATFLKNFIL